MITFEKVSVTYPGAEAPAVSNVDLRIEEGEMLLIVGPTGSGKSTLLGAINGLIPRFTGGTLRGSVAVAGRDTSVYPARELSDVIGFVQQDPLAGFVTDTVEAELAFGMEQLGLSESTMRQRVEATVDLLGLADLRDRKLNQLSGGQQQRVAIGSVFTSHPKVIVLDEPTSALDPTSAEEVLAALTRMVHDLGITVVLAEHRLERVVQFADRIATIDTSGQVNVGVPSEIFKSSAIAPPIVHLGRFAAWNPLPMSVRDARREAKGLREQLSDLDALQTAVEDVEPLPTTPHIPVMRARGIVVAYDELIAVRNVNIELNSGEVTALMGRNGCGKTSLLWALQGSGKKKSGKVEFTDNVSNPVGEVLAWKETEYSVGLVPQTPTDLLYLETVDAECAQADSDNHIQVGTARELLNRLAPGISDSAHPRDLSEGQKLSLVLAITLVARPKVLLLDEPTRGLDYEAKDRLRGILHDLADEGISIVLSTHDVEFVAAVCSRIVMMADGEVIADGQTREVLGALPAFSPQVSRILDDSRWLTVDQVELALGAPQ